MYAGNLQNVLMIGINSQIALLYFKVQSVSGRNFSSQISSKRITFARNLRIRNGFKMWYSWSPECGKINIV